MNYTPDDDQAKWNKQIARNVGRLLFIGCLFLGMAGGFFFDEIVIGVFAGLGIGLILMGVAFMSASAKR